MNFRGSSYVSLVFLTCILFAFGCGETGGKFDRVDAKSDSSVLTSDAASGDSVSDGANTAPPVWNTGEDSDKDGIPDLQEAVAETDPHNADTDEDGVQDGEEFTLGTNPLVKDSDGDGKSDGDEVAAGTDPARADTDGDGFSDVEEAVLETDPIDRFNWAFGGTRWPDLRGYAAGVYGTGWDVGEIMPDAPFLDQWDQALQLSQFYGYVILLDFSAGWCIPCRQAAESAESLWKAYRDQGFMVIHILTEGGSPGTPATLALQEQWSETYGLSFPVVREEANLAFDNLQLTDIYPGSIPFLVLLDRNMQIDSGYGGNQEVLIAARAEVLLQEKIKDLPSPTPGASGEETLSICDQDGDGHKNISCGGADCYDQDSAFSPTADERCDLFDRDCDGAVHEGAVDSFPLYRDDDGDGYGNPNVTVQACAPMWPWEDNNDDCDDLDPHVNPDTVWYVDSDGDGYGDPAHVTASCLQPDGYVDNGQDADDNDDTNLGCWKMVTVGRDHSCGLRVDGRVVCWGDNTKGQCTSPEGVVFEEITAGYNHTCALSEAGIVHCWGANMSGALDAPADAFDTISCGLNFCCGLIGDSGDNVVCWGENAKGQSTPPSGTFVQVSARGGRHACGINSDGAVICWGGTEGFQGSSNPTLAPTGTFVELSVGHFFTNAIREDGQVLSWGTNVHGQGTAPDEIFVKLRSGTVHSCGLTDAGAIACWGSSSIDRTNSPEGIFIDLDVDQLHSCAVGQDGLISCWGYSEMGQTTPADCAQ
jgi:thiol-disulfide isomerase/thioredoxin